MEKENIDYRENLVSNELKIQIQFYMGEKGYWNAKLYIPLGSTHRYIKYNQIDDYVEFLRDCWDWDLKEGKEGTIVNRYHNFKSKIADFDGQREIHIYKDYYKINNKEALQELITTLEYCKKRMTFIISLFTGEMM